MDISMTRVRYETLVMDVEVPENLASSPEVNVMVYDHDALSKNVSIHETAFGVMTFHHRIFWEDSVFQ